MHYFIFLLCHKQTIFLPFCLKFSVFVFNPIVKYTWFLSILSHAVHFVCLFDCFFFCLLFIRTNTLLEKVASAVEQSAFYSALWGSILTSPAVRLPGVTFVLLHLNRKLSMEDQLYVIGSDIELMVYVFLLKICIFVCNNIVSSNLLEN